MENNRHRITSKEVYSVLVTLLLIAVVFTALLRSDSSNPALKLTVTADSTAGVINLTEEQLGQNCAFSLVYYNVSDVTITIGKKNYPLSDAIRDGLVTVEQIIAQAQSDSRDRSICREKFSTDYGCTTFIYQYNDYDIVYRYDVFECSDGQTHLFKDIVITPFDQGRSVHLGYTVEYPSDLLYEDWGLSFAIQEAGADHIEFAVTQSEGQHANQLILESFWLNDSDDKAVIPHQMLETATELLNDDITTLAIDWPKEFDTLAPGVYKLYLLVSEQYEQEDVHPLQRNYRDTQTYSIEFTVP